MRRIVRTGVIIAALAGSGGAALAKPRHRPSGGQPAQPNAPAMPPAVPSPPALANEPEPTPPAAGPAAPPIATSTPSPPEPAPPPRSKANVELEALVAEYGAIRDELFRSRAKAAVLGEALLKTQMVVTFRYEAGRAWPLKRLSLRLDERPVFTAESVTGSEPQKIFETVATPGRHVLTARVEASGTGEDRITYATENSFGFDIADGKLTRIELSVDENGSGPAPLAKRKQGTFDLRVKAIVKSLEMEKK